MATGGGIMAIVDYQALQDRIHRNLADPDLRDGAREVYTSTLRKIGVAQDVAANLADRMIEELEQPGRSLREAESSIYSLFSSTMMRNKYVGTASISDAFADSQDRRSRAFSSQLGLWLDEMPAGSTVVNLSTDHEPLALTSRANLQISDSRDPDAISGQFSMAVLNNVLHHASPERAAEILSTLSPKVTDRLVVIENTSYGETATDIARDTELQFMNEYLFQRLMLDPATHDVAIPANYGTAEEWSERIETLGWRLQERDSFPGDPHHTILVFEKDAPG